MRRDKSQILPSVLHVDRNPTARQFHFPDGGRWKHQELLERGALRLRHLRVLTRQDRFVVGQPDVEAEPGGCLDIEQLDLRDAPIDEPLGFQRLQQIGDVVELDVGCTGRHSVGRRLSAPGDCLLQADERRSCVRDLRRHRLRARVEIVVFHHEPGGAGRGEEVGRLGSDHRPQVRAEVQVAGHHADYLVAAGHAVAGCARLSSASQVTRPRTCSPGSCSCPACTKTPCRNPRCRRWARSRASGLASADR